ncbi:hypothetical protein ABE488_09895 [Luteimonas sp. TWI662]
MSLNQKHPFKGISETLMKKARIVAGLAFVAMFDLSTCLRQQ